VAENVFVGLTGVKSLMRKDGEVHILHPLSHQEEYLSFPLGGTVPTTLVKQGKKEAMAALIFSQGKRQEVICFP
jgi:hypothetical protein